MFTFLLDEYRHKAIKEYHLRLCSLYLVVFALILAAGLAFAIPQFAVLESKRAAALLEEKSGARKDGSKNIAAEVKALKEKISVVKEMSEKQPISVILEKVLSERGQGIRIMSISLLRGGQPGAIVIGGIADTREALVAFSKRLQGEPSFSNANLPVSSLAKNKDISFSISIDSKF